MKAIIPTRTGISVVALLAVLAAIRPNVALAEDSKAPACSAAVYHQFDFWIGDWNAYDIDKPNIIVAHNRVSRILDGCVLFEDYQGADGHKGQSFTIYDATRTVWHQTWVTNRGELLTIEGTLQNGRMVLSGSDKTSEGLIRNVRGLWEPVKDGVRETANTSLDGGKTWTQWFDIVFRRASDKSAPAIPQGSK